MARQKPRGYVVRIDPEFFIDVEMVDACSIPARACYVDSLFYLAGIGEPAGMYPHAELVRVARRAATRTAAELTGFGVWDFVGLGYLVRPRSGCCVVPERRAFIPDSVRRTVYARDGHRCVQCGVAEPLSLDHIWPWSLGGPDTEDNLRTLCRSCNSSKGAKTL